MSGHNVCLHREIKKNIFELSSISSLIWSSDFQRKATQKGLHYSEDSYEPVYVCNLIRVVVVVVVVLLFYIHSKHLKSCRDGQLT